MKIPTYLWVDWTWQSGGNYKEWYKISTLQFSQLTTDVSLARVEAVSGRVHPHAYAAADGRV